jgi:hypothetical protein
MKRRGSVIISLLFLIFIAIAGYVFCRWFFREVRLSVGPDDAKRFITLLSAKACRQANKNNRLAGIRFQQTQEGDQYAICIIQEPNLPRIADPNDPDRTFPPFVTVSEPKPIKLGSRVAIICGDPCSSDNRVSIVFSPNGSLSKTLVMVKANPNLPSDIFYGELGIFKEDSTAHLSTIAFVIYDKKEFEAAANKEEYLKTLQAVYLKPQVTSIR